MDQQLSWRPFSRKGRDRPFILGHRGARAHAPENTLLAFERALADGADGVEVDVRMTQDGELIICHDDHLLLQNGQTVSLSQLNFSQVRRLNTHHGQPLMSLRELLHFQAQTGAMLNVELKGDLRSSTWLAKRAAQLIAQHGGSGILLSSFHPTQLRAFSQTLPTVPTALLFDKDQWLMKRALPMKALACLAAHPQASLLNDQFIDRLRKHVPLVNTWTVNDPDEAQRLSLLGVDAIITDDPALILQALKKS